MGFQVGSGLGELLGLGTQLGTWLKERLGTRLGVELGMQLGVLAVSEEGVLGAVLGGSEVKFFLFNSLCSHSAT